MLSEEFVFFLQELGYTRMVLKSDGEPSITALVTAVQREWAVDSKNFQRQLIPRTSPVDDHASNGAVEAMVHSLEGLTRTSKVALEEALGISILPTSPVLPWLVRHQSYLRNRFVVRSSGRTPFEELTMSKFQSPLLNFAEAVMAKESGAQEGKLGSPWDLGIWLGRSTRTNEHLVGTRVGVIRARTVKRRPKSLKWDRELYDAMNFVPWLIDGPVARPESGWEPTPECKACDEERSKRRGRPFNHTPECKERQADFRARLREMKMLPSDGTSPVLDPSIRSAPLLPGTSVIAEPSSSSSVVVSHPMAVDSDLSEPRGIKRALEGGDMEISEVCSFISDVNVNEEPHPSVPEMEFTDEEEWQAMSAELARLDEFEAKKDIPRNQATGPLLTFTWVRTVKNGMPNYRLCLRPFGRQSERSKESLFCPTPGPQIYKMMLVLAAHFGWSVRFFDVSRAFLHTPIKDPVFAVPPEEYHSPIPGGVWEMTKSVYGLEEAPADFDEHFGNVAESLCDDFGSLGLERLTTEPAAFRSKSTGVMMCKHMDDGVVVGESNTLDRTLTAMRKHLLMKINNPQVGSETKFLGRLLIKTERGFQVKPLSKLFDSLLSSAGMGNCSPVQTPGVRSESRIPDEEPKLGPAEHKQYRTIVGKMMFLASERPDIQF